MSERMRVLIAGFRRAVEAVGEALRKLAATLGRLLSTVRRLVREVARKDAEQAAHEDWDGVLWPAGEPVIAVVGHVR
jgi:hypothetical protein